MLNVSTCIPRLPANYASDRMDEGPVPNFSQYAKHLKEQIPDSWASKYVLSLSLSRAAKWSEEIQDVPRLITPHAHVITRTSRAQLAIFDLQPTVKNLHHLTAMVTAKVPWFKAQFG